MLQEALDIAMEDYLEYTRQAYPFSETERVCAETIFREWMRGRRHRIWLANKAIAAIEAKAGSPVIQVAPITASGP